MRISMHKLLINGLNGQLGSELKKLSTDYPEYNYTFIDKTILDMSDTTAIKNYFIEKSFDVIINCAAYTAVDKAESELALADTLNHQAVLILAQIAKEKNIKLIHISTDYVFDGRNFQPYIETDITDPINNYGKTKLDGEKAIFLIAPMNSVILRTSWLYASLGNNFVKTMLRLGKDHEKINVIFDQIGSPTFARDLAKTILDIIPKIKNTHPEIYHYSNEGTASWYDFAKAIFKMANYNCQINPITSSEYPTQATRPHYSLLNKNKIKKDFEITIPHWHDSLMECLKETGNLI